MGRELTPADSRTRRRCQVRGLLLFVSFLTLVPLPASWAATTVVAGSDPSKTVIRGTLVTPDQVLDGMLVIDGDAGRLLYADRAIMDAVKPGQCEALLVLGSQKAVCVKDTVHAVPKATQTLAEIQNALQSAYPLLAPLTA